MKEVYEDIKSYSDWKSVTKINKGWSKDSKYYIEDLEGRRFLLRINDIDTLEAKKKEYEIIKKYNELNICMSIPQELGVCNEGKSVYMLLSWIEGNDLKDALPNIKEEEQYKLGVKAGEILKKIHSIPVNNEDMITEDKRFKKLYKLDQYMNSDIRIKDDEFVIDYIKNNIKSICIENPVYQHGDFHPGNIIYTPNNELGIIDFNRWEVGDPYEEFYRLESFGVEVSIPYCIGQIDGYFQNNIPNDFWEALSVYVAHASLFSIKWAEQFSQDQIDAMVDRCYKAFDDFNNFKTVIPKWYDEKFKERIKWNV